MLLLLRSLHRLGTCSSPSNWVLGALGALVISSDCRSITAIADGLLSLMTVSGISRVGMVIFMWFWWVIDGFCSAQCSVQMVISSNFFRSSQKSESHRAWHLASGLHVILLEKICGEWGASGYWGFWSQNINECSPVQCVWTESSAMRWPENQIIFSINLLTWNRLWRMLSETQMYRL